jgi:hypothetical protein
MKRESKRIFAFRFSLILLLLEESCCFGLLCHSRKTNVIVLDDWLLPDVHKVLKNMRFGFEDGLQLLKISLACTERQQRNDKRVRMRVCATEEVLQRGRHREKR